MEAATTTRGHRQKGNKKKKTKWKRSRSSRSIDWWGSQPFSPPPRTSAERKGGAREEAGEETRGGGFGWKLAPSQKDGRWVDTLIISVIGAIVCKKYLM
jgi:hypothetical protein